MKIQASIAAVLLTLSLAAPAAASWRDDVFTDLNRTAPRSAFADLATTIDRTIFDDIRDSAPVKAPDRVDDGFVGE